MLVLQRTNISLTSLWFSLAVFFLVLTILFTIFSHNFGYDTRVKDMPIFILVAGLVLAGAVFLYLPYLIKHTLNSRKSVKTIFYVVVLCGVCMRVCLLFSEPVLEDDYQRYLWDGAVTAHGLNPYQYAPDDMETLRLENMTLKKLALESGLVLNRINHPELRTIYPPVTQAAFALAYYLGPFQLTAWRLVIFFCDIITLILLYQILRHMKTSVLWSALYWWNPIVLKELFNSAHMEAILLPLVLGAVVLSLNKRPFYSGMSLLWAAGVKIWPVLLLPIVWRPLLRYPLKAGFALISAIVIATILAIPIVLSGLNAESGFVAYATKWQTNSALFPLIKLGFQSVFGYFASETLDANIFARGTIILCLGALILYLLRKPIKDNADLIGRISLLSFAIFMLSPAQFPWYYIWIIPFLCVQPNFGLLLLSATLPLYYTSFHFMAHAQKSIYNDVILCLIWVWQRNLSTTNKKKAGKKKKKQGSCHV
ncbi:MAG: hypothetical protein AAF228_10510, partial [Pseudomonadota bacterium]